MSELSREGDYIKFNLLDKDVVLYNDGLEILAFDNVCPHRGARFFLNQCGSEIATCKYHGLTITRGHTILPWSDCEQSLNFKVNRYSLEKLGGFVFFGINPINTLSNQLTTPLYELLEMISFDCDNHADVNRYFYECSAVVAVENALEPLHLPFVHRDSLMAMNLGRQENVFWGKNSLVRFEIQNKGIVNGLQRVSRLFSTGAHRFEGYCSIHLFPFTFISSTFGLSYSIQSIFPISTHRTDFISRLYSPRLSNERFKPAATIFLENTKSMNRQIFVEDHEICKRVSFEDWRRLLNVRLSPEEIKISRFRENLIEYG
jgi:phenylpropionate dioxygenase-like ring-hydroxylating dioxygenase large terminal subunit